MRRAELIEIRTLLGFVGVVMLTVAGNLMLKLGAAALPTERVFFGILGWKSAAGLVLFGLGGLLYAVLLRAVPLNVAQAFIAAQLIGVVLAASLVLSEPISPARWLGLACIALGIVVVAATARA